MVTNRIILRIFYYIFLLAWVFCYPLHDVLGLKNEAQDLSNIQKQAKPIESISSKFMQTKHLSIMDKVLNSKGRFYFRQPDCLRWEYISPYKQGFALCQDQGIKWNEISGQKPINTSDNPLWKTLSKQLIAWSKLDIKWLKNKYAITVLQKKPSVLELIPKEESMGKVFSKLKIYLKEQENLIQRMVLYEGGGDRTEIRFHEIKINKRLPAGIFSEK